MSDNAEESRPQFYILDAYSMIFRVFHGTPEMTGPKKQITNAIHGVYREIRGILRDYDPDYIVAAMDSPGRGFRGKLFEQYKANRPEMPSDLVPQIPVIKRVFEAFQIPSIAVEDMEADDVIATLAKEGESAGMDVVIFSGDKDLRQLLTEHVCMYSMRKREVIDVQTVMDEWGIRPDQVVDFLSMTGDTADNIPGLPGIGKKYASQYLNQFGTLAAIIENVAQIKEAAKRRSVEDHADKALLAKHLVTLRDDLPIEIDWRKMRYRGSDTTLLQAICDECGFYQFSQDLRETVRAVSRNWA